MQDILLKRFRDWSGKHPIMMYRAPGRLNIIGEHTDYNQGKCLPAAIAQSVYLALAPAYETQVFSLNQENTWYPGQFNKQPDWAIYFQGVMDYMKSKGYSWPAFKLMFGGDLAPGSGLSSSSAITCGFISILDEFSSWNISSHDLTKFAVQSEKASGLDGGMMDQISILHGKKNHALFIDCQLWTFQYIPTLIPGYQWLIADTGVRHRLVDSEYNSRSGACKQILKKLKLTFPLLPSLSALTVTEQDQALRHLSPEERNLASYVWDENRRVGEMVDALSNGNVKRVGDLLFEGHNGLQLKYRVSCQELDFLVGYAKQSDIAVGARMMGGGFGGCTLHLIPESETVPYQIGMSNAFKNRFGYNIHSFPAFVEDGVHRIDG